MNASAASPSGTARRPLRYLAAAGLNTIFGLAIYPVLLWTFPPLQRHYLVALLIAQAISLCFAYANYKIGVFQTRGQYAREITAFASFYLVNYAANWAALPLLVEVVKLSPIVAQLLFSLIIVFGSYFWHSRVTFKDRP
ncbi:MAG TPA: GtrA family protein [Sphingomicrobium sp.]|jgi:putative flippase GtrA|nr:GtrA family protein [Sphingomicrobium sp.]